MHRRGVFNSWFGFRGSDEFLFHPYYILVSFSAIRVRCSSLRHALNHFPLSVHTSEKLLLFPIRSAGSDRTIRYWQPAHVEESYQVCAPLWPDNMNMADPACTTLRLPQRRCRYAQRYIGEVPVVEEYCSTAVAPAGSTDSFSGLEVRVPPCAGALNQINLDTAHSEMFHVFDAL